MDKLLGFLPDYPLNVPGAMTDCNGIIPTTKGFKAVSSPADAGLSAVSATVNSLATLKLLDNTKRTIAGTATTLEEASTSSWTDRSRATPAYNCPTDGKWSFAPFGNVILAANYGDVIQVAAASSAFANISGSPQATYIAVSDGFVMAVNINETDGQDKWHCSAYLDHTDWTEAVSTQCTSGRLIGGTGRITGVAKFGSGFVAWKEDATYIARYVGAPIVFQWDEIPGNVGCYTSHAATDIGDRIAFMGTDDFYIFDGSNNISIGKGMREWFFEDLNPDFTQFTTAVYNPVTAVVTWHYVSASSSGGTIDKAVTYNVRSNTWGKYDLQIHAAAQ